MAINHEKMTNANVERGLGFRHDVPSGPVRTGKIRNQENETNAGADAALHGRQAATKKTPATTPETTPYKVPPKPSIVHGRTSYR